MCSVVKRSLALGVALVLLATAAWGQSADGRGNGWFHVSWEPSPGGGPPAVQGRVVSAAPYRVTNVRLRVEGLDAAGRPVGQTFGWALGDIVPGGETSFLVDAIPGAATYRIDVVAFDLVSRE